MFIIKYIFDLTSIFCGPISLLIRLSIFRSIANTKGINIFLGKSLTIKHAHNIQCGDNISIHDNCYIDAIGKITIGNNVSIAHQTSILSFNHSWLDGSLPIKYNPVEFAPVIISDDVWIGCGVRIMPGVTIGSRSVIAAGAVVTKNVDANSIYAGVPARKIKDISI